MTRWVPLNEAIRSDNNVITVGTFDGVHAGHRLLIERLTALARERNAKSTVVTFDPHPREVIHPDQGKHLLLTTLEERALLLDELGVDQMIVIPFDRAMSLMDSESFLMDVIYGKIGLSMFLIGYDHHFGKDRQGSIETVKKLGRQFGFEVEEFPEQDVLKEKVSSSRIRKSLSEQGDVELVNRLLGRPYQVLGRVVRGDGRGRTIGFPTANVQPVHPSKVLPANGVYMVRVTIRGREYPGMLNIGTRPTFALSQTTMEVHILDLNEDLYGEEIHLNFIRRLRDEKKFESTDSLVAQLKKDRIQTRVFFADD